MPETAKKYGKSELKAWSKEIDWTNDTIKVALLADTYTPDQDTHEYFDDVSIHEASGAGYTAGGATLTGKTMTYDAATNKMILDADDVVWSNSSVTARYAVVYGSTGTPSTSPLIGYVDFGENKTSANGNFSSNWNASGILTDTTA